MMKFIRSKLVPILVAFTLLLFLTNNFGLIDIEKTAIIIALGIDSADKGGYEVTAQIAVPNASADSKNNESAVVTGKGKTIADAIDDIGVTTGWYPLLSFCNLIAISGETLDKDVMTFVDFFNRTDKIPDSSLLIATEGKAKDILSVTTPLDSVSAFALEKILVKDIAKLNRIAFTNVKDFSKGYFSKSKSSYMPYVKTIESEETQEVQEGNGGGSGGSGGNGGEENKQKIFDCSSTLIYSNGVNVGLLDENETLFFNMRKYSSIDTFFDFDEIDFEGEKVALTLGINEEKRSYSLEMRDRPIFKIDLALNCHIEDLDKSEEVKDLFTTQDIPENVLKATEEKVKGILNGMFDKLRESGCDLFQLTDELYKFHHRYYDDYKEDFLNNVQPEINVKCKAQRNNRA